MALRTTFFVLLLLGSTLQLAAQDHHTSIRYTFATYRQLTLDKDFAGLMDYIYPKLFELVPREQMIATFEALEGEDLSFTFSDLQLLHTSDTYTSADETYALVQYSGNMQLRLRSEAYRNPALQDAMAMQLGKQFGPDNLRYEPEKFIYHIHLEKSMWAITPAGKEDWTFIENDPGQAALTGMLIPADVRAHFQTGN
jgi:hypothetical protein